MNLSLLKSTVLAAALCWVGGEAYAEDTTKQQELTGHTSIVGTEVYNNAQTNNTLFYLNSSAKKGGAATLNYKLDESFDVTKVKSAELQLYVDSKPTNKTREDSINFFALNSLSTYSNTYTDCQDGKVRVYSYGGDNTKRYVFSGTAAVSVTHNTYINNSLYTGKYNAIDVTDLVRQFKDKKAGDNIYIGISIDDFAAETWIQGYGSTNQPILKITYSDEALVDYTISYKIDDTEVSKKEGAVSSGETVTATLPITVNGQKYYAADGATTSFAVSSDTHEFVVNLRKANEYNYTVKNSFGEGLSSGTCVEGETVTGNYVQYINKGGTLYEAKRGVTGYYQYSFVPTENNYTHTIEYTAASTNNVIYFSEGESIKGATLGTEKNAPIRCSDGKGGYFENTTELVTLQPGKYTVSTVLWGTKDKVFTIKADDTTVHTASTTGSIALSSSNFELTKAATIKLEGGTSSSILDYIYITKTADIISLNDTYVHSTYCPESDLDFTDIAGVEVYKVKVDADKAKAVSTLVTGKIQAGEGILLKRTGDATTVTVPTTTGAEKLTDNDLVGATEAISDWTAMNAYMLVSDTQFQKIGTGTLAKGKAYLLVSDNVATKNQSIYFGDEVNSDDPVTAINGVADNAGVQNDAIYTLQGVKVEKAEKGGIYIINGKKYIK